jgi:dipeptidase E
MGGAIFLGGGGSEHDEGLLWDVLFDAGQRVILWPFAQRHPERRRAAGQWLVNALAARGDFHVETWLDDQGRRPHQIHDANVLVISGGNTFDLLAYLRQHDWLSDVREFVAGGGRVYGGSAGAILLGADVAIAAVMDSNDAGIDDTHALDLLSGCVVHPHYKPRHAPAAHEWAREYGVPVLGIPERAGVVEGHAARNTGPGTVHVFTANGHRAHHAQDTWTLAGR